jgi:hypothetical protein
MGDGGDDDGEEEEEVEEVSGKRLAAEPCPVQSGYRSSMHSPKVKALTMLLLFRTTCCMWVPALPACRRWVGQMMRVFRAAMRMMARRVRWMRDRWRRSRRPSRPQGRRLGVMRRVMVKVRCDEMTNGSPYVAMVLVWMWVGGGWGVLTCMLTLAATYTLTEGCHTAQEISMCYVRSLNSCLCQGTPLPGSHCWAANAGSNLSLYTWCVPPTHADMDDEAMFRIEPKIAEYLRAAADQRRGAREAAEALAALRFKALTLLESFARKVGASI